MTYEDNKRVLDIGEVYKDLRVLQIYGEDHLVVECIICKRDRIINEEGIDSVSKCICRQVKEYEGKKHGHLTVIKAALKGEVIHLDCTCSCGKAVHLTENRFSKNSSCGCQKGRRVNKDLVGRKFGRLSVKDRINTKGGRYICECDCNPDKPNIVLKTHGQLVHGKCPSCGCLKRGEVK